MLTFKSHVEEEVWPKNDKWPERQDEIYKHMVPTGCKRGEHFKKQELSETSG